MNISFNQFDPLNRKSSSEINEQAHGGGGLDPQLLQRIIGMLQSQSQRKRRPPQRSTDGGGFDDLGGLMQQMMGGGQGQQNQDMPMWDAFSGKSQKFMRATDDQQGLESSRDINGNIMKGYMDAAGQMRVSQPSGGTDPSKFNVPHGSGTDPKMVRGLSPEDLPINMDYKALDKASMQAKQAGAQDPQVQAPHQQSPGAPVDIPDGMGGTDQQKAQAMVGAQFGGGVPKTPEPQQQGGMPRGGGGMGSMIQKMMGGGQPQGGMPAMGGKEGPAPDMMRKLMSDPRIKKLLKKLMQK